jgi:HAD superfamily phosphoserine phosphatase-like hydrolase
MHGLICFDFDDVIADSRSLARLPFIGGRVKSLELGPEFLEGTLDSKRFKKFMEDVVRQISGARVEMVMRVLLHMKLHRGVRETLKKLHGTGLKIVIISTNDESFIRRYLEKHRLSEYVDHVYAAAYEIKDGVITGRITGDVLKDEKIHIVPILEKKYGVKRKEMVYVGDGPTDLPIMRLVGRGILFNPNALTKAEVFTDRTLRKKKNDGELFLAEGNDLRNVLEFIA